MTMNYLYYPALFPYGGGGPDGANKNRQAFTPSNVFWAGPELSSNI